MFVRKHRFEMLKSESEYHRDASGKLADRLEAAREDLAFLRRVLDRQCGPARVAACGIPKKAQGPLVQRVLFASRDEAALLVPGVKHDSVGYVGHFEWGADYVEVHVRDDTDYRKMRDRLGYD